jgi:entericidin B
MIVRARRTVCTLTHTPFFSYPLFPIPYVWERTEHRPGKENKGSGETGEHISLLQPQLYNRRINMIRKLMTTLLATLFLGGAFVTLAGCNTMEGAGKDIQQGGKAITDEAKEQKKY